MIKNLSHAGICVLDYESAKEFYTGKLGFEVRQDVEMDGRFRWLTVGLAGQPELEFTLMEPGPPWHLRGAFRPRGELPAGTG